jgi:hypothetical protein
LRLPSGWRLACAWALSWEKCALASTRVDVGVSVYVGVIVGVDVGDGVASA